MAQTNFANLSQAAKTVWSKDLWTQARDMSFWDRYMGGDTAPVNVITELTKSEKGLTAVMQLVAELQSDGVAGDAQAEGYAEALRNYAQSITIDQIAHSVENKGRVSDQATVVKFRENAMDRLAFWLASRIDELCFLTASGIDYSFNLDGSPRQDNTFSQLAFAADVKAPTANRHVRISGTGIAAGDTSQITPTDTLTYGHIVDILTEAEATYLPGLNEGGRSWHVLVMRPEQFAQLKKDQDFQRAVITGADRGMNNPFFTGATLTVDGIAIATHRRVYNTKRAATGSKWGAAGDVDGARMLLLGRQALGFVDLEAPVWQEKEFDYGRRQGILIEKMFGLLKPQFYNDYTKSVEDFGVMVIDSAI